MFVIKVLSDSLYENCFSSMLDVSKDFRLMLNGGHHKKNNKKECDYFYCLIKLDE